MRGRLMNAWGTRAAAMAGLGAILFTAGCGGAQNGAAGTAQAAAAAQPGAPVVVGCEPNQRTLVRSTVVNGMAVSQVDCVSNMEQTASVQSQFAQPAAVPVSYYAAPRTVTARQAELGDTRIIPAASYPVAARPVRTQQVVYDDDRPVRVVKRGRSVKKSAIIIGSSAGVGAGVGAAVGGKKGALIGAVVGGGGATLWDQITRRKD